MGLASDICIFKQKKRKEYNTNPLSRSLSLRSEISEEFIIELHTPLRFSNFVRVCLLSQLPNHFKSYPETLS
ncbi:hypothetical protein LOK49_LG14G02276 [Camellia lanceoleosa]|uniref:Uncharacterized protein n=1 Tax=Camellia lanceoleosa TaxID=1840588 RepID=A0ACC0FBP9_9ERIC|nr:hypothetical protein LOK49_LG14G02276 [Camellia lanceoleosa]